MGAKASRKAFGEAIALLGKRHPQMVVLDADLSKSTMTGDFAGRFPRRHLEMGIAEHNMLGVAAGLALCGKVPVVTSFAAFLVTRLETIRMAIAYNRANVKIVGTHAGLGIGPDGATQMGLEDVGAMRALPNVAILQPADEIETRQAVAWMLRHRGPVYLRLTRQKLPDVHASGWKFRLGVADPVFEPRRRKGRLQAVVFATGGTVSHAVDAARSLDTRGFRVRVLNAGTLKPFDDEAAARAAARSQRIVTVEDHSRIGGLGSAVCEALASRGLACPVVRLGARDFGESGSGAELYDKHGISADHIAEACVRNIR